MLNTIRHTPTLRISLALATIFVFTSSAFATDPPPPPPPDPPPAPEPGATAGWAHGSTVVGPMCRTRPALACQQCCTEECRAAAVGQPAGYATSCDLACSLQCPPFDGDPPPEPVPVPDPVNVNVPDVSPTVAFLTGAAVLGALAIRYLPRPNMGGLAGGPRLATTGALIIGLPIILGTTAGEAFADYVDNYSTGIDNSVTGSGPTGTGQCPPGEEPVTYAYGTACVPSSLPPAPPTPACSTIRTCADIQAEGGGVIITAEDGLFACDDPAVTYLSPAQVSCLDGGTLSSREGCLELKCARADDVPLEP